MQKLHNSPYVSNSFLNQFAEVVLERGGKLDTLCARVDLPVEMVVGPNQLVPFDKFIALLEVAAEQLHYPDISLGLAQKQDIAVLGPMSVLLSKCENFADALSNIMQYLEVLVSGFTFSLNMKENFIELKCNVDLPELYPRQQFQNYLLASTVSLSRELVGWKYPLRGCFFTRNEPDPEQQAKLAQFFGCPVAFGADALCLTMDKAILLEPVDNIAKMIGARIYSLESSKQDILERLTHVIVFCLASGDANLETVAKTMGYSRRTLNRRLSAAGISFSTTLNSVRYSQACRYLNSTHYKISDIAALLGYTNQSAFTRSYIRWCGMTPSEYRATLVT
ncbi:hypothetical protein A9Q81_06540 [Gammaproteobacteria bacterium 42_54_T18]|nr:hypothetical protein A9Q81_06540 [Gammaproteobacteria bacterium 42_54_T18]